MKLDEYCGHGDCDSHCGGCGGGDCEDDVREVEVGYGPLPCGLAMW